MKQLQQNPKNNIALKDCISYAPAMLQSASAEELKNGRTIEPIFLIKKDKRTG